MGGDAGPDSAPRPVSGIWPSPPPPEPLHAAKATAKTATTAAAITRWPLRILCSPRIVTSPAPSLPAPATSAAHIPPHATISTIQSTIQTEHDMRCHVAPTRTQSTATPTLSIARQDQFGLLRITWVSGILVGNSVHCIAYRSKTRSHEGATSMMV